MRKRVYTIYMLALGVTSPSSNISVYLIIGSPFSNYVTPTFPLSSLGINVRAYECYIVSTSGTRGNVITGKAQSAQHRVKM